MPELQPQSGAQHQPAQQAPWMVEFRQEEDLTTRLRNILEDYPMGVPAAVTPSMPNYAPPLPAAPSPALRALSGPRPPATPRSTRAPPAQ